MRNDEKMLHLGGFLFVVMILLTVFLQVCYRMQNKELGTVKYNTEKVKQNLRIEESNFSKLSAPNNLRNSVTTLIFNAETVTFNKKISINDLATVE